MTEFVQTVLGPIAPEDLGTTLMHEHVLMDLSSQAVQSSDPELAHLFTSSVTFENLDVLRQRPMDVCPDNARLDDPTLAFRELLSYREAGGKALVDCTVAGMGRQVLKVRELAQRLGLHVVVGTGYYVEKHHPSWIRTASLSDVQRAIQNEILYGIEGSGIRPGIIGEIGASGIGRTSPRSVKHGPFTGDEEKVLRAAARAAATTGLPISIHLDRREEDAIPVVEAVLSEGLNPTKVIVGHMDRSSPLEYELAVLKRGVWVQFDGFGRDYRFDEIDFQFPSDGYRLSRLDTLVGLGYGSQLLVSQDVTFKIDLASFGGPGYAHVLEQIVPSVSGTLQDALRHQILVENPRKVLTISDS